MTLPPVREDLQVLSGYHSPQVEVPVRLNTNESPVAPPEEFYAAVGAAVSEVAWHRYPDRSATKLREAIAQQHGVSMENIFAANGSNEVLQTLMLAYGGPNRTVATFEPTYALHRHIANIVGTKGRQWRTRCVLYVAPRPRAQRCARTPAHDHVSVFAEQSHGHCRKSGTGDGSPRRGAGSRRPPGR